MRLSRRAHPFDSEDFVYELKIDGWRALAVIQGGECKLVSRNRNTFRGFEELRADLRDRLPEDTVLDARSAAWMSVLVPVRKGAVSAGASGAAA
jgi:bifunctional non-homologous end joining protein LigD